MIGDQLKRLREAAGLSAVESAAAVGVTKAAVYGWERGRMLPSQPLLRRLMEVYRVDEQTRGEVARLRAYGVDGE
jgi:transcriptional regulator with XRE-family HTH domain